MKINTSYDYSLPDIHIDNHYSNEILKSAKSKDQAATTILINKYRPLILKYIGKYTIKDFDNDDMFQEATLALLNAIEKFDISKNISSFDSYASNSIINRYGTLIRTNAKRNSDSSLNIMTHDDSHEIINLIPDTSDIEQDFINHSEIKHLNEALLTLSPEELSLINAVYLKKSHSLLKYCNENSLNYMKSRKLLKKALHKLKILLS